MKTDTEKTSAYVIGGTVNVFEPMGSDILYDVTTDIGRLLVKTDNQWQETPDTLTLEIPKDKILYYNSSGERIYEPSKEKKMFAESMRKASMGEK